MAEVTIREFTDIENGQHFRRKVKVQTGEDEKGKPVIADEWEYVLAHQVFGSHGFSVRQAQRVAPEGGVYPETLSGGGDSDYVVKDLLTGRLSAVRSQDFNAQYERISIARLPKGVKEKLGEGESVEAGA